MDPICRSRGSEGAEVFPGLLEGEGIFSFTEVKGNFVGAIGGIWGIWGFIRVQGLPLN